MKNKAFLLIPLVIATPLLSSCQKNKEVCLTYGTYLSTTILDLKKLSTDDLNNKAMSGEVFLLATYQGEYSEDCLCWSTFENVISNYINTYDEMVYLYDAQTSNDAIKDLNIAVLKESTPMLYIFNGQKQIASFSYSNKQDKPLFSDTNGEEMYSRVHKYIKKPKMFYVDDEFLESNLKKQDSSIVLFMRSTCGDCKYVIPNVLIPYINHHDTSNELWVFNLDSYYTRQLVSELGTYTPYSDIKNKYELSEETCKSLGYQGGVVPTIHYYEKGDLKDATVFFNDEVAQKEDGSYYISNSFYSEERLTSLHYVDKVETKVLKGMEIKNYEVAMTTSGYLYWIQEKAALYHTPLLNAFLDYYLL